ncbi:MAG: glycosyltransferase [Saprospiraceae bacterium]|nr:glycosyltransferase [Saprospiraceae bacterium]
MAAKVAVIIITYNAEIWIKDCLDSFLDTLPEGSMVIIADNQSNDATLSILDFYTDKIHLEQLSQNLGFGRANNLAIDIARAKNVDYLYLLNQDTVVTPGAITTLIEAAENHPQFGVISPLHIFDDKSLDSNFETYL